MGYKSYKSSETLFTQGNIGITMFKFAIPFMLANLLQLLYGTVDLLIIGHFCEVSDIAAVSTGSQIMQTITNFITGFSTGGTVLIGTYFGAGQQKNITYTIGTFLSLFVFISLAMTAILVPSAPFLSSAMQTPPEAKSATIIYVLICGCGIIAISGYNALSAIMRGLGDSKTPLIFVAIACSINILLDILFVGIFHKGVAGVAFATILAQICSVIFAIHRLYHMEVFDFCLENLKIKADIAKQLVKIGLPISIESFFVGTSFLFITAMVNRFGIVVSATIGICEKLASISRLPAKSFSSAVSSMVSHNMGAGEINRAKRCLWTGIFLSGVMSAVFCIALFFVPEQLISLYNDTPAVIEAGSQYMHSYCFDTLLVCVTFCMAGFFSGCSKTMFTLVRNLVSTFCVRIPLAWFFCNIEPLQMFYIGMAAPLASMVSILICIAYFYKGNWKQNIIMNTVK